MQRSRQYVIMKKMLFVRLVYFCELKSNIEDIVLQTSEHSEYRFIKKINDLKNEKISPFLLEILKDLHL